VKHQINKTKARVHRHTLVRVLGVLKGWAKRGMADNDILLNGRALFDGLYAFLQRL
jgi:hypothetical protein